MKTLRYITILLMAAVAVAMPRAQAQWDDLYYNPATDEAIVYGDRFRQDKATDQRTRYDDDQKYDEEYYAEHRYDDDEDEYYYEYYYTSRIRRFHRPFYGFDFYDPCYVDAWFYDPFFRPGVSIYIYNDYDYWRWRSWRRWNRWNNWYSPWGYAGGWYGNNVFINNYYYGGVYGYNYYDPYWIGGGWYGNNGGGWWYNDHNANGNNTYYGARRTGMTKTPRTPVRDFTNGTGNEPPVDATPRVSQSRETLQPGNSGGTTPTVRKQPGDVQAPATTRQGVQPGNDEPSRRTRGTVQPDDDRTPAVDTRRTRRETRTSPARGRRTTTPPAYEPATRSRRSAPATSPNTRSRRTAPATSPKRGNQSRSRGNYSPSNQSTRSRGTYNSGSTRSRSNFSSPSRSSSPSFNTRSSSPSRSSGSYRSSGSSRSGSGSSRSRSPRGRGN